MIRKAVESDIDQLLGMANRFIGESGLPLSFDRDIAYKTLELSIDNSIFMVYDINGILAGAIMGYVQQEFTIEGCAYIVKLYVEPEFRGLGVSRSMVRAFDDEAARLGASCCFTSSGSLIGSNGEKLYDNLFIKQGYLPSGRAMVKDYGGSGTSYS